MLCFWVFFFFLTAAEETVSPLAGSRVTALEAGWGKCFHSVGEGWICPLACLS